MSTHLDTGNTYRVAVIIESLGVRETYTVVRPDEWKARTAAMSALHHARPDLALSGQFVDYEVETV